MTGLPVTRFPIHSHTLNRNIFLIYICIYISSSSLLPYLRLFNDSSLSLGYNPNKLAWQTWRPLLSPQPHLPPFCTWYTRVQPHLTSWSFQSLSCFLLTQGFVPALPSLWNVLPTSLPTSFHFIPTLPSEHRKAVPASLSRLCRPWFQSGPVGGLSHSTLCPPIDSIIERGSERLSLPLASVLVSYCCYS